jgi:phosphatidylinositol alpha-mannosyltransferase
MLKIAIVTSYSFLYPGGVQHQMICQATALSQIPGVSVHIWAADVHRSYIHIPVPHFSLGRGFRVSGNGSGLRISIGRRGVKRFLRKEYQYDLVHIHEPFYPQTVRLIHKLNTPIIGTFHAHFEKHFFYNKLNWYFKKAWEKFDLKTAVSPSASKSTALYFKDDFTIIPNGIIPPNITPLPYTERENAILFIGRNEQRKGLPVVISAFNSLRHTYPNLKLWLVGPNTCKISGPNIINFGITTEESKLDLLSRAQCLCVPSLGNESFGVILLEAMACGCPVIASCIEGYKNVITPNKNGLFFKPGSANDLKLKLIQLLDHKLDAAPLIKEGYKTVQELSWDTIAQTYISHYEKIRHHNKVTTS